MLIEDVNEQLKNNANDFIIFLLIFSLTQTKQNIQRKKNYRKY